jgi:putative ABC transport system permease protein
MFSLQRTLSLGYLRQHPTRAGLVVLSIALGVATLVATQSLNKSLSLAGRQAVNPLGGVADLIVSNGSAGVPRSLAGELRDAEIPGLADVRSVILGRILLKSREGDRSLRPVLLVGVARQEVKGKSTPDLSAWGVEIDRRTKLGLGDRLALVTHIKALASPGLARQLDEARSRGREEPPDPETPLYAEVKGAGGGAGHALVILGSVVRFPRAADLLSRDVLFTDLAGAATVLFPEKRDHVTHLQLLTEEGADPEAVRARVQEVVGDRAVVRTMEANFRHASEVTAGLELGFAIGGAGALVIGLFLVYNVLSVSVAERRHDIGILRSVGATRGQISLLFLSEAGLLGLAGALLGLPLGYLLGTIALGPMQSAISELLVPVESAPFALSPWTCAGAVAAGVATAFLAALVPSLQAALEEPADAVRRVPRTFGPGVLMVQITSVLVLLAGGFGCAWLRGYLPERMGVFSGVVLLLVGAVVATPLLTMTAGRLLQPLARVTLGLQARLAADNLVRSPGRTGLVIAALAATGGLMVQTAGFLRSTEGAIHEWIDDSIAADLFISCGSPITKAAKALPMHESLIDEVRALDGVDTVLGVRFHEIDFRDHMVFLLALDPAAFGSNTERALARNLGRFARLREGETALVSENFAALYHVAVGDRITFRGPDGLLTLEVIGTVVDYTWNRGTVVVDRGWYREHFADHRVDVLDVWLEPGTDPDAMRQKVEDWGLSKSEGLHAVGRREFHATVKDQLQRIYQLAYAQQGVVGQVALLGVVSALFISVLQRRRDLGLLRAVGATRAQVLGTVVAEAGLMGLLGGGIGFLIGLGLEWYVIHLMVLDEAGFLFPMRVPWFSAGVVLGSTLLLATVVGLWPAYHATRLRIPEAIAYE